MGHTAAIRFTQPVDPRTVWEASRIAVNAPADWTHHGLPDDYPADLVTNLLWQADPCGADALVTMFYRTEGAQLDTEGDGPAGYVEIHLDTRYVHTDKNIERAIAIASAVGVPAAIRDDFTLTWSTLEVTA